MEKRLPRQEGCDSYVITDSYEDGKIVSRIWMDQDSGRMCEFYIALFDKRGRLVASADCSHGVAHYHDERHGHGPSSRLDDIGPVSTHAEIEWAYTEARTGISALCIRYGIVR